MILTYDEEMFEQRLQEQDTHQHSTEPNLSGQTINVRQFSNEEIATINQYVFNQVPHSLLPTVSILTEEPLKKARIFVTCYRIIDATIDYLETGDTKDKIKRFNDRFNDIYSELYEHLMDYDNHVCNYNSHRIIQKIMNVLIKHNEMISEFINSFLVFAERQQLISTDKVSGISLDSEEGLDVYKKITSFSIN